MFRTAISRNTDSSYFYVCTVLVPNDKKKRVSKLHSLLTLNIGKLKIFLFDLSLDLL